MKKALALILFSQLAHAGALDNLCFVLEGIPLPFCKYTKYHTCNSGVKQRCVYKNLDWTIKKIDDPTLGKCADADMVCTKTCTKGPDGTVCNTTCKCNSPPATITQCRTQCNKCAKDTQVIDLGIECPLFCGQPGHCATFYNGLELAGPEVTTCTSPQLCGPGSVDIGGPKAVSECAINAPSPVPADYNGCCYAGGPGAAPNTNGLPSCN